MTGVDPRLSQWRPVPAVVLPSHQVPEPAVPVVDVHNHIGRWLAADGSWLVPDTAELAATLATAGVETLVNLDGRWGDDLVANVDRYDHAAPGAYLTFCHVEWAQLADSGGPDDPDLVGRLTAQLEQSAKAGARGVKVWKDLGLSVRDATGALVRPDDPRVVAVLQAAGELGLPVLIHTADPVAFFEPLDERNERLDELGVMPQWWFGGPEHPTFAELIDALHRLVGACPGTTFIGAHVGCHAEDLGAVGDALDPAAELERRHRRPARRGGPAAAGVPPAGGGVPRPGAVRQRLLPAGPRGVPPLVAVPGDRRRALLLLRRGRDPAAGPVADQRCRPTPHPAPRRSTATTPTALLGL